MWIRIWLSISFWTIFFYYLFFCFKEAPSPLLSVTDSQFLSASLYKTLFCILILFFSFHFLFFFALIGKMNLYFSILKLFLSFSLSNLKMDDLIFIYYNYFKMTKKSLLPYSSMNVCLTQFFNNSVL
uniref:hypothetical protein n=1 Tax=Conidiobolus taihushanensis TaxID=2721185 RepID=UPI001D0F9662|nr:hypothetical protein LK112_mgp16 [Conidiobolus taihushanensis]QZZ81395.1 hypothetical protein [Conidiobolus taihushanensis]